MCRIFGFKSIFQSRVHHSLINAENAIGNQSARHPDGWGVAYYIGQSPHLIKSAESAFSDDIFKKVSGVVTSHTVLGHIRKATLGTKNILNSHPFQYGPWVFAHNGNIKKFQHHKEKVQAAIAPQFRRFILGDTDSEHIFFFLLSRIEQDLGVSSPNLCLSKLQSSIRQGLDELYNIIGEPCLNDGAENSETFTTFIITNGDALIAYEGGKKLYYSTYKNKCQERETCPSYAKTCEAPTETGFINHLIISSEPISGENIWLPLQNHQMVAVDKAMKFSLTTS